jgi:hypothetical protein
MLGTSLRPPRYIFLHGLSFFVCVLNRAAFLQEN